MNKLEKIIIENNLNGFWLEGGTDKMSEHSYCDFYDNLFAQYLDKKCNILEIGTWQGAFAFAMSKLMPKCSIVTMDVQEKFSQRLLNQIKPTRITNHHCNAYSFQALELIQDERFNLIIDDGTHLIHDDLFVLHFISDRLLRGGFLVIEDIDEDTLLKFLSHVKPDIWETKVHDFRNVKQRGDDMLVCLKKL